MKPNLWQRFIEDLGNLSHEGGWIFWALILLAFGIIFSLLTIWSSLRWRDASFLFSAPQWEQIFRNWESDTGSLEKIKQFVAGAGASGMAELEQSLFAKARRRLPFAFVLIGIAPLVGLLGTVSGMMNTFHGMAATSANAPIETISRGISEALITTQTGLIIAVPSFVVCTLLKSRLDRRVITFHLIEVEVLKS